MFRHALPDAGDQNFERDKADRGAEFYPRIQQENKLLLLDVRNDKEFGAWRIESRHSPETLHIPYVVFVEDEEDAVRQVPADREIVVVCAKGGASAYVAEILRRHNTPTTNLGGGMIAWGSHYVFRPVVERDEYQIYQIDRASRGCLSYVLISKGQAAIIDPLRHIGRYRQFLSEIGADLTLVLDTHAHADHISGGSALSEATGVPYYLHPYDAIHPLDMLPPRIRFEMLQDGQSFTLGDLTIRILHTPGHTLGQVNLLVTGSAGQSYFFSGDNLFLLSLGRPDLGGLSKAWAPLVYETIFGIIKETVPPQALVLPGHYASFAEANAAGLYGKPLADVWQENPSLQMTGKEEFVEHILSHLPEMPPQYAEIKRVNIGLSAASEQEANELELGKNVCALE